MPTQNQLLVAEALSVAREHGFEDGFALLQFGPWPTKEPIRTWFLAKCQEHGIPTPSE